MAFNLLVVGSSPTGPTKFIPRCANGKAAGAETASNGKLAITTSFLILIVESVSRHKKAGLNNVPFCGCIGLEVQLLPGGPDLCAGG